MKPAPRTTLATHTVLPAKGQATQQEPLPQSPLQSLAPSLARPLARPTLLAGGAPASDAPPVPVPERGPPAITGTVSMNLRLPVDLQRALRIRAFETGVSGTQHVVAALRAYLDLEAPAAGG